MSKTIKNWHLIQEKKRVIRESLCRKLLKLISHILTSLLILILPLNKTSKGRATNRAKSLIVAVIWYNLGYILYSKAN